MIIATPPSPLDSKVLLLSNYLLSDNFFPVFLSKVLKKTKNRLEKYIYDIAHDRKVTSYPDFVQKMAFFTN